VDDSHAALPDRRIFDPVTSANHLRTHHAWSTQNSRETHSAFREPTLPAVLRVPAKTAKLRILPHSLEVDITDRFTKISLTVIDRNGLPIRGIGRPCFRVRSRKPVVAGSAAAR
jgi:hypothetical protein